MFPGSTAGSGSSTVTAAALVQSLALELSHSVGAAKKKKKRLKMVNFLLCIFYYTHTQLNQAWFNAYCKKKTREQKGWRLPHEAMTRPERADPSTVNMN